MEDKIAAMIIFRYENSRANGSGTSGFNRRIDHHCPFVPSNNVTSAHRVNRKTNHKRKMTYSEVFLLIYK